MPISVRGGEHDDWKILAMHDPSFRRGLWYRTAGKRIQFCSGREGDDAFASVPSSRELLDVLYYAEAAAEHVSAQIETYRQRRMCCRKTGCAYVKEHKGKCWVPAAAEPSVTHGGKRR